MKTLVKHAARATVGTAVLLALSIGVASADPVVITPTVEVAATNGTALNAYNTTGLPNFDNTLSAGQYWGQEIASASHRYDTNLVTIARTSYGTVTLTFRTAFNGSETITNPNATVNYADVFLTQRSSATPDHLNSN